jgi:wyosine [tRNA(Phe)-imidazoG37] synthetase (radical SAM superfamily)
MEKLVYGPVPSRRFGISLGVDVVPFKVCTLDCTYCQLGHTTTLGTSREMFVPVEEVVEQVGAAIARGPQPDIITFAGSGEPTLYSGLGQLAQQLRAAYAIPLLLITNGTLLFQPDVAADAAHFNLVAPSLDAGDSATFALLNRPAPGISYDRLVEGIASFSASYPEKMRLEVFFVKGVNDSPASIAALVDVVAAIAPPRIELNTAVRPTADGSVRGVSAKFLAAVAGRFPCPAVPIAAPSRAVLREVQPNIAETRLEILTTLARRPCTVADLSASLGVALPLIEKTVRSMENDGEVASEMRSTGVYYYPLP